MGAGEPAVGARLCPTAALPARGKPPHLYPQTLPLSAPVGRQTLITLCCHFAFAGSALTVLQAESTGQCILRRTQLAALSHMEHLKATRFQPLIVICMCRRDWPRHKPTCHAMFADKTTLNGCIKDHAASLSPTQQVCWLRNIQQHDRRAFTKQIYDSLTPHAFRKDSNVRLETVPSDLHLVHKIAML